MRGWNATVLGAIALAGTSHTDVQAATDQAIASEAERLVNMRNYEDAYNLLNANLAQNAGEIAFDRLLAQSALETGRPAIALMALERIDAQDPNDVDTHLALGRAYFDLWQWQAARDEFVGVFTRLNNQHKQKFALDYLQMIDQRMRKSMWNYSAFLEVGTGGDDNANAAPRIEKFFNFTLSDNSRQRGSMQFFTRAQGTAHVETGRDSAMIANLNYAQNWYDKTDFVDNSTLGAAATYALSATKSGYYFTYSAYRTEVLNTFNNQGSHLSVLRRQTVNESANWDLKVQFGQSRYVEAYSIKDSDQVSLALRGQFLTHQFAPMSFDATLHGGKEIAKQALSPFSRDYWGGNTALTVRGKGSEIFIQAGVTFHSYPDKFFAQTRTDQVTDLAMGMNLRLSGAWQLRPTLSTQHASSSVDLYDYRRTIAGVAIRRDLL